MVDTRLAQTGHSQCITFYSLYGQYFDDNFLYCFDCAGNVAEHYSESLDCIFIIHSFYEGGGGGSEQQQKNASLSRVIVCFVGLCHFFLALQVC